jgi:hypothetical protein
MDLSKFNLRLQLIVFLPAGDFAGMTAGAIMITMSIPYFFTEFSAHLVIEFDITQ